MKKFSLFQKILIGIMSFIFVLTISLGIFKAALVESVNTDVFNMVTAVRYTFFESPIKSTSKWVTNTLTLEEVRKENDKLKENTQSIGRYQSEINNLKTKNAKLEAMLNFKDENSNLDLQTAKVVFRDFERWNNVIKINVGSSDNVKVNDAVVLPEGLIGRIESVDKNTSTVRLLISNDKVSKVAIKIKVSDDEFIEGIIDAYDSNQNKFTLSLLETSSDIKKDQPVSSSGSGGTIPSGLLVGYIYSVEPSVSQLGESILVTPSARFDSFETVFVVRGSSDE